MRHLRIYILLAILALCVVAFPFRAKFRGPVISIIQTIKGKKTVADRLAESGAAARERFAKNFNAAEVLYPPKALVFAGFKSEDVLEVYASNDGKKFKKIKSYSILAASGKLGPKLMEGDAQVPEGIYHVESLNPNSLFYLSLRLNYPNTFDKEMGKTDGRVNLGSDIMIHGKQASIGCLAMGDIAIEELFVMAADTGTMNIKVILSPVDFRVRDLPKDMPPVPVWSNKLYQEIKKELLKLNR